MDSKNYTDFRAINLTVLHFELFLHEMDQNIVVAILLVQKEETFFFYIMGEIVHLIVTSHSQETETDRCV